MKTEDLQRALAFAAVEVAGVRDSFRDKGAKYFARPLGMAAVMVWCSHHFVYQQPVAGIARLDGELKALQATTKYAGDYQDLDVRIKELFRRLPTDKDPESWLLRQIRESLREEGIVPTEYSSPTDLTMGGYRFISITLRCNTSYKQIASWIARLERGKELLYIQSFTLSKEVVRQAADIGRNSVDVTITTIVPATAGGGE